MNSKQSKSYNFQYIANNWYISSHEHYDIPKDTNIVMQHRIDQTQHII